MFAKLVFLGIATALALPASVLFSEINFNPDGADAGNEYIELRGNPFAVLPTGTYFVGVEGDAGGNPGDVQTIIDLSGQTLGANGFIFLVRPSSPYTSAPYTISSLATTFTMPNTISEGGGAGEIENTSVTFFLIQTATAPSFSTDIDSNNDGTPDGAAYAAWTVLDSISILDAGNSGDRGYGQICFRANDNPNGQVGTCSAAQSVVTTVFTPGYVARISGLANSYAPGDWLAADTEPPVQGIGYQFESIAQEGVTNNNYAELPINSMNLGGPNPTIPEPSTIVLSALGLAAAATRLRRRA
jgi:hypothetical protein